MRGNLETKVRAKVAAFVAGRLSLRSFNRWFVPAVWDVAEHPESLRELVYGIKARLYDYDSQFLTKEGLRHRLSSLVGSYSLGEQKACPASSRIVNYIFTLSSPARRVEPVRIGSSLES
jgi:hypothetical protein